MAKFNEFIRIAEAAKMIGITPTTLRTWERKGKIASYRNPINNWRMYKSDEIEKLMERIQPTKEFNGTCEEAAQAE